MNHLLSHFKPFMWFSALLLAALTTACGGGGDQGRAPILGMPSAELVAVNLSPTTASIQVGGMQQFVATASFADGSSKIVTTESTWSSSVAANATVGSTTGLAKGVASGTTVIGAAYAGKSATAALTVTPATLVSMALAPPNPSIPAGNSQAFLVTGTYSDGTSNNITAIATFSSANLVVATINTTGTATGKAIGVSVITAKSGALSATTTLTVTPAVLLSIAMTPANPSLQIGATQQLTITGSYSDGSSLNVTNSSGFTSASPGIATINASNGLVTAVAAGSTVMTGVFNGKSASTTVTVTPAMLTSISITPSNASILTGNTQAFVATGLYSDGTSAPITNAVTWTSSATTVATVLPSGTATGLTAGATTIRATLNAQTATALLTVTAPVSITSIAVTPTNPSAIAGANQQFVATGFYSDGSSATITNTVTWTSSAINVATVLPSGLATAVTAGTATISATLNAQTGSTLFTVTAPVSITSIAVTPINPSAMVGGNQQFMATATYSDATTGNITDSATWTSSNGAVATISNTTPKGNASALSVGVTTITATQASLSGNTTFNVTPIVVAGINLGTASNFAVLAGNSITNNSGGLTLVTGDVGSPSQTVDPVQTAGYTNYKSGAVLATALGDVQVAIANANNFPCDVNSAAGIDLGGLTFTPGVYCYAGEINITGTFTMNGSGLYLFRTSSTLNTASNSIVALIGGASSSNVFWVPSNPTTLGANSAFIGTIMTSSAAITMGDMATLQNGRVLSASAVTLRNNVISK